MLLRFFLLLSSWHSNTNFSCVHLLQRMNGCEWDDETGEVNGFSQYDYDGENFLALDLQNRAWTVLKPQTVITKLRWDAEKDQLELFAGSRKFISLPTVSLLQKTPSSPISCHATGFYPDRAMMFWRKDGEEIHEGVAPGEILLNNDGTFQMSVDLELSSVTPEDWSSIGRHCVLLSVLIWLFLVYNALYLILLSLCNCLWFAISRIKSPKHSTNSANDYKPLNLLVKQ
uniref:Ig-like domain-containing protein n=1 Tax=Neolamprologus brichardi TaxID=32507 RepID=A0A3Q4N7G2_NEOBR